MPPRPDLCFNTLDMVPLASLRPAASSKPARSPSIQHHCLCQYRWPTLHCHPTALPVATCYRVVAVNSIPRAEARRSGSIIDGATKVSLGSGRSPVVLHLKSAEGALARCLPPHPITPAPSCRPLVDAYWPRVSPPSGGCVHLEFGVASDHARKSM